MSDFDPDLMPPRDRRTPAVNDRGDPYMAMPHDDPAAWMLKDGHTTTPVEGLYRETCYICRDPEYAQMGLPLCFACILCGGHTPADDSVCENGHDQQEPELLAMWEAKRDAQDQ